MSNNLSKPEHLNNTVVTIFDQLFGQVYLSKKVVDNFGLNFFEAEK